MSKYYIYPEINTGMDWLKNILQQLERSSIAYKNYLENGRTYREAIVLKKYNSLIREILLTNMNDIPPGLRDDAKAMVAHYDAWTEKWNELQQNNDPQPEDEFVFQNDHRFPREAANRLINSIDK
jgi:hypothetical protein